MRVAAPADELLTLCRQLVDPDAHQVALHPGHDGTAVLRASTSAGEVIVKAHRSPERHHQEVHAYRNWVGVLGDGAPEIVAVSTDPPAIIVAAIAGQQLSEASLDCEEEASAYSRAGALLRLFHDAGPPRLEPDISIRLAERGEYWLNRGRDVITAAEIADVRAHLHALTELAPIEAVPCHLDFMPRNLLVRPGGGVAVIDFEHSRYDLAARDVVRLADRVWPERPDLEEAFLAGYGALDERDREVIAHCIPLDRLTGTVRHSEARSVSLQ
ncbi:aminoglycoside phosphotransferase family protein [Cryptosporangium phraense]|uniref:Aminoglycoside phosphotransferase family protein n=1 Tax=Cryptosporangium phraense TaxID=2593070 RepID=A0A545AKF8_9ACTN|nr:aminoglycoside phosphotransferase family protein [Cryptosporangium phraense]TQS41812.1 aminoglycoside phosphotransferase family protein [Cryptosporangium phraense]